MSIRFNPRLLLVSVLLFSLQFCRAQSVSFDLGGSGAPNTSLWDLSGFYTLNLTVVTPKGFAETLVFSFNMTQDAKGNLSGPTNDFQELDLGDNSSFAVSYRIKGHV